MMAEAAPPSGQQLELGGVRDTPALNAAVPMLKKKQRDFWWVCVLDRTLQPLMAGLLMLSFLILLWLCLSYAKELATGPVNSEVSAAFFLAHFSMKIAHRPNLVTCGSNFLHELFTNCIWR